MPCFGTRKKSKNGVGSKYETDPKLQDDFDQLKSKNEHNIHIIAAQTEELDRLRRQISEQSLHNNATNNENLVVLRLRNRQTLEALLEKEKMLQQRDNELDRLREQLEAERNVQQIESMNFISRPLPEHLDEEKLTKKEQELRRRENELEVEMKRWEMERAEAVKPALNEVEEQLKELKLKNNEILARLSERERELERFQMQPKSRRHSIMNDDEVKKFRRLTVDVENDKVALKKLKELALDLKAQKYNHQALLDSHAEAMAEKDKLLQEQQEELERVRLAHDSATRRLEQDQKQSLAKLKDLHMQEMENLQLKLEDAEERAISAVDSEVEKVLQEFEQAEHSHSMRIEELERSHKNQMSLMARDQKQQLRYLKSKQHDETKRLSWRPSSGAEQSQSMVTLRKTGGPGGSSRRVPAMLEDARGPDLTPQDKSKVQVYVSSVCSNVTIKQRQEQIGHLLSAHNIKFEVVDVAASQPALQYMKRQNNGGSTRGRAKELPQVFVGGQYHGQFQDLTDSIEEDRVQEFLQPRTARESIKANIDIPKDANYI